MPRSVLGRLVLGRQRYAMAELGLKLIEGFTRDYMPGERPWDALGLLLIMYKMVKMHQRGRTASSSELSRVCGIPRETLRRKLARLVRLGFVEKRGHGYVIAAERLNDPMMLNGFRKRVVIVKRAPTKLLEMGN